MSAYVREFFRMGTARSMGYLVFGMAAVSDLMCRKKYDEADDLLALILAASEQACIDSGRWNTGWLLTHLQEPPWDLLGRQPATDAIRPFARLPDPVWVAAAIAHNKDVLALREARRPAGARQQQQQNQSPLPKGRGRGRGGKGTPPPHAQEGEAQG